MLRWGGVRRRLSGARSAFQSTSERQHVRTSARQHLFAALAALAFALPAHALSVRNGMVAAEHQLASQAGVQILKAGGNAVDAAVATSLAVGVVNPTSCGIGGGGFMLIYDHATHRVAALDYRETAPAAASRDMFIRDGKAVPELSLHTGLAVAVPGEIAGLFAALRRYGTKSFAEVAAPAIALARDGFAIEAHLADSIARNAELIRARPALAALLFRPDGTPLRRRRHAAPTAARRDARTHRRAGPVGVLRRRHRGGDRRFGPGGGRRPDAARSRHLPAGVASARVGAVRRLHLLRHAAAELRRRRDDRSAQHHARRRPARARAQLRHLPAPARPRPCSSRSPTGPSSTAIPTSCACRWRR